MTGTLLVHSTQVARGNSDGDCSTSELLTSPAPTTRFQKSVGWLRPCSGTELLSRNCPQGCNWHLADHHSPQIACASLSAPPPRRSLPSTSACSRVGLFPCLPRTQRAAIKRLLCSWSAVKSFDVVAEFECSKSFPRLQHPYLFLFSLLWVLFVLSGPKLPQHAW